MPSTTPHVSPLAPHCDECSHRLTGVEAPDPKVIWRACQCVHHARCSQCGWPITDDDARRDHHGLCAMCDTDDLMRGRPPEDRHELSALLAALGLSPDTSVTFQFLRGAELDGDWGDYRVEWAMIPDVAWRYAATNHVATHPWRIHLSGWDAPRIILRWRQWRIGESAFLERTWLRNAPRWTYRRQVRAVDGFPSRSAIDEFKELLGERDDAGRTLEDLRLWFEKELRPEIAATWADGQEPLQETVASRLDLSLEGLAKKFGRLNAQRRERGEQKIGWKRLVADVAAEMRATSPHC